MQWADQWWKQIYSIGGVILQCCKIEVTIIMSFSLEMIYEDAPNEWGPIPLSFNIGKENRVGIGVSREQWSGSERVGSRTNSGVLVESLSLPVVLLTMVIIFLGSAFGSQETAVVGMFGVPACSCAHKGLLSLECLGCQAVAVVPVGCWECLGWGCSAEHWRWALGRAASGLSAGGGLRRLWRHQMLLAGSAVPGKPFCSQGCGGGWVTRTLWANQNVKHLTCSQTLKAHLISF